jgi:hypothetical protein
MGIGRDENTGHRSHTNRHNQVRCKSALFFIQQAVHDKVFVKIATVKIAKEA